MTMEVEQNKKYRYVKFIFPTYPCVSDIYVYEKEITETAFEVTYPDVVRYYRNKTWCIFDSEWGYTEIYNVTHWMPLPELPKEE